ncbi:MAG: LruC domain-containing protein [Bacteroidota bacterium]
MKQYTLFKVITRSVLAFLLLVILMSQSACKKSVDTTTTPATPSKFTELKVNPAFQFDSYVTLDITVGVSNTGSPLLPVVQVYQGDPRVDGKLIATGATDANFQFKTSQRVPSRLKELWVCNVSATGANEYVSVPISGTTLNYTFGKSTKSTESNDCNTGTPISVNGSYTVNSGSIYVVQPGINVTNIQLTINDGGTVRICGSANITALSGSGKLIVSPSGVVTIPVTQVNGTIENYGTANFAQSGNNKKLTIASEGTIHNWGVLTLSNSLDVKGALINEFHTTIVENTGTSEEGRITNYCQLFINSNSADAFKITSGSASNPGLVNNANGYIKVTGNTNFTGGSVVTMGSQSLIETGTFQIAGSVAGPASQGAQIHALGTSKSQVSQGTLSGYIDLWATSVNPQNGTFGPNITWHNPGYTIQSQNCSAPVAPVITSTLLAAGLVGTPIVPYTITATGTGPITFSVSSLPSGLSYNASTHVISGTPTTVQQKNVTLTADNLVGTDTRILDFTIAGPTYPPVITSPGTAHTPVNQQFTYTIIATGTGTITYNATNLPAGLQFNATTHQITGAPTSAGVYTIPFSASSPYGIDNHNLVLTVGTPPSITSALTASGTTGHQFTTYKVTATGSGSVELEVSNLPGGLEFDDDNHSINGTPSQANVVNVTLKASNEYGNDSKILVITIKDPVEPPAITSPMEATCTKNQPFNYGITFTGTHPVTFSVSNLPAGLSYNSEYNVISGIPTTAGTTNIKITATNSAGSVTRTLSLKVLSPVIVDTDGDGVPDALDAYPNDPTRAFNSYYPNQLDFATYAFEDLWPAYGDYDCNDMVVNFNYQIVTNAQNKVVDLIAKFKIKASGASFDNGFGVALATSPGNVESVKGCIRVGSVVKMDPKGFESGHTTNTVIIPVDAVNTLLGRSIINTQRGGYTVQTTVQTVTVHLSTPQASIGTAPFNPFIFINQDRGKEVHLKDHAPTELANPVYFGSLNDASDPGQGHYYRSATGLPWGLEIPVDFSYPVEKADIVQTYLHFAAWAQSGGVQYPDWYMDKTGYRKADNVY